MPTYAYACTACDHRFEAQQSFSDDALTECPECAGRLRKLFNSVGIVFKGSGFYKTDSRGSTTSTSTSSSGDSTAAKSDSTTSGSKESTSSSTASTPAAPTTSSSSSSASSGSTSAA